MRRLFLATIALAMLLWLVGCAVPPGAAPATAPTPSPTAPPEAADPRGEESLMILEPGPGSRVVSPVRVAGISDPTFERNLVVRILLEDGAEVALVSTMIEADLGQRGPYSVEVPFEVTEERQGFIQVFDISAQDGDVVHLNSVGVTLAPSGDANITAAPQEPERIAIFAPALGDTVSGGVAEVEGFAIASFEQTLVVQVLDQEGNVVGEEPIMVNAPDLGQPGPFTASVAYTVAAAGPGRIVVRDISPAHGGDVHVASVPVNLQP